MCRLWVHDVPLAQGVPIVALDVTLHWSVLVYLVIVLGVLLGTRCINHCCTSGILQTVRL